MEPLAAVSLAGNILQFVHTTKQLVSSSRQIFDRGTKHEYLELETLAQELQGLAERITYPKPHDDTFMSTEDKSIRSLADQCVKVAEELLAVLQSLKLKGTHGKLESFYQALKSEWKKEEIEALQRRLDRVGQSIDTHLMAYDHRKIFSRLDELAEENRRLEAHRAVDIKELTKQFKELFDGMNGKLQERDSYDGVSLLMLRTAVAKGLQYSAEQVVLEQLRFDWIDERYVAIPYAHEKTLSWLFGEAQTSGPQCNAHTFLQWLGSDDNLYWISGKPGSGKSTLMKFLCSHQQTKEQLNYWIKEDELICAEYFFWNAGKNHLQKSQQGLLRSLIYQILRQRPEIIPSTYPDIWRLYGPADTSNQQKLRLMAKATVPLTVQGLLATLRTICALLAHSEVRLYFFIDGLDEYEGKPDDVIDLIGLLRSLPNVKLCVSSRPWNEFEQAYGKDGTKKLYMQDFNRDDISTYIYDIFLKDENYQELEDKDTHGNALIQEIVNAAKGVFLWVFLVVRSFQEGLKNGDSISNLQRRLRSLPTDLNEYFERILLSDVNGFYRTQSAQMFTVTLQANETLPLMAYWFLGEEDPDFAFKLESRPLTMQQTNKRLKDMRKRLNACCKGLLEVQYLSPDGYQEPLPSSILFNWKVDFLHRTVRDFLRLPDTHALLERWNSATFDPHQAICKAILAQVKTAPQDCEYYSKGGPVSRFYRLFCFHADALEDTPSTKSMECQLRTQMDAILKTHTDLADGNTSESLGKMLRGWANLDDETLMQGAIEINPSAIPGQCIQSSNVSKARVQGKSRSYFWKWPSKSRKNVGESTGKTSNG